MFGMELLIPAIIGAVGAAAGGIGSAVSASEKAKADKEIADRNRASQESMARDQAQQQMRQRADAEQVAGSESLQQALMQKAQSVVQGAGERGAARSAAAGTIRSAFGGLR